MAMQIVSRKRRSFKDFTRVEWICHAAEFLEMRRGLAGAGPDESLAGYVDGFKPVFVQPGAKVEGETWFVWFVSPGQGRSARVVNKLAPGLYVDAQDGTVYEHEECWVLVLGTVTRVGSEPLLSPEMLRGE